MTSTGKGGLCSAGNGSGSAVGGQIFHFTQERTPKGESHKGESPKGENPKGENPKGDPPREKTLREKTKTQDRKPFERMEAMTAIRPLWTEMPLKITTPTGRESRGLSSPFGQVFASTLAASRAAAERASLGDSVAGLVTGLVENVKETDAERVQMEYLMATGQLDNPALLTIASSKAQLSVELLVQLRNRALDAYNELIRITL